jgi:hypothetical protein
MQAEVSRSLFAPLKVVSLHFNIQVDLCFGPVRAQISEFAAVSLFARLLSMRRHLSVLLL